MRRTSERRLLPRITAFFAALILCLQMMVVPALAQEDWSMLSITLSWTDASGNPGNVDNVQHLAVPVDGSAGGADGTLALVLFGLKVGHGRAVLNLALTVDHARSEEHRLR